MKLQFKDSFIRKSNQTIQLTDVKGTNPLIKSQDNKINQEHQKCQQSQKLQNICQSRQQSQIYHMSLNLNVYKNYGFCFSQNLKLAKSQENLISNKPDSQIRSNSQSNNQKIQSALNERQYKLDKNNPNQQQTNDKIRLNSQQQYKIDPYEKAKTNFYLTTPPSQSIFESKENSDSMSANTGIQENATKFFIGSRENSTKDQRKWFQRNQNRFYQTSIPLSHQEEYRIYESQQKSANPQKQTYSQLQNNPDFRINYQKFYICSPQTPGCQKLQVEKHQNLFYQNSDLPNQFNLNLKKKSRQSLFSSGSNYQRSNYKF